MNYFTTSLMKNLFSNDNNLPAFEQAVTELFRSELEKSLNEILAYELTVFLDYEFGICWYDGRFDARGLAGQPEHGGGNGFDEPDGARGGV